MASITRSLLFGNFSSSGRITLVDFGLLVLRLGMGGTMAFSHGLDKLIHFDQYSAQFMDFLGLGMKVSLALAVFAEFFCSLAVILGLFTRLATLPLIITMLVAAFIALDGQPWDKKEMAVLYLIPWLTLFFAGPGRLSLDYRMSRR